MFSRPSIGVPTHPQDRTSNRAHCFGLPSLSRSHGNCACSPVQAFLREKSRQALDSQSRSMDSDLVAVWEVPLNDATHRIEFEHGTTTGRRVIRVDGKVSTFLADSTHVSSS